MPRDPPVTSARRPTNSLERSRWEDMVFFSFLVRPAMAHAWTESRGVPPARGDPFLGARPCQWRSVRHNDLTSWSLDELCLFVLHVCEFVQGADDGGPE